MVLRVERWLVAKQWRKVIYGAITVLKREEAKLRTCRNVADAVAFMDFLCSSIEQNVLVKCLV